MGWYVASFTGSCALGAAYSLTDEGVVVFALGPWGTRHLGNKTKRRLEHEECYRHLGKATDVLLRYPIQRTAPAKSRT
jgi:hypothetical protein